MFVIAWKREGYPRCRNSILEDGGTCGGKNLLLTAIPKNKMLSKYQNRRFSSVIFGEEFFC